jgi:hypothetical protein
MLHCIACNTTKSEMTTLASQIMPPKVKFQLFYYIPRFGLARPQSEHSGICFGAIPALYRLRLLKTPRKTEFSEAGLGDG